MTPAVIRTRGQVQPAALRALIAPRDRKGGNIQIHKDSREIPDDNNDREDYYEGMKTTATTNCNNDRPMNIKTLKNWWLETKINPFLFTVIQAPETPVFLRKPGNGAISPAFKPLLVLVPYRKKWNTPGRLSSGPACIVQLKILMTGTGIHAGKVFSIVLATLLICALWYRDYPRRYSERTLWISGLARTFAVLAKTAITDSLSNSAITGNTGL